MIAPEELPHYTLEDYRRWEGRWELIEGIPWAMTPSPGYEHQHISQKIAEQLGESLADCAKCEALLALDWVISEDTVLQPDNLVICYRPEGTWLNRPPALIFEILSPSTARKDRTLKYSIYEREGVGYYVLVDPERRTAEIHHLRDGRYEKVADRADGDFEFELDACRVRFDFAPLWP